MKSIIKRIILKTNKAITFLVVSIAFFACTSETPTESSSVGEPIDETLETIVNGPYVFKGRKVPNPYSMKNMQEALKILINADNESGEIIDDPDDPETPDEPTDYYVKITIRDVEDFDYLDSLDVPYFNYPLDYEIEEEDIDEEAEGELMVGQEGNGTMFVYTTVDNLSKLSGMSYELIDECYIPDESNSGWDEILVRSGKSDLRAADWERIAINNVGLGTNDPEQPRSGSSPAGWIKVLNNVNNPGVLEGVKGVKVTCQYLVKIASVRTNASGYYSFAGVQSWTQNPRYMLSFSNTKDFVIWKNWACLMPATYNLGRHNNTGYNHNINTPGSSQWNAAVTNNGAYDYYSMCEQTGIQKPPFGLKIWSGLGDLCGAPMIHHLTGVIISSWIGAVCGYGWFSFGGGITGATAATFLTFCVPDIVVNNGSSYKYIYKNTWHELSHASHFSKIGQGAWMSYVDHIVYCMTHNDGIYGSSDHYDNSSTNGAGICGVSESWAYAQEYYKENQLTGQPITSFTTEWFSDNVRVLYQLMSYNILSPQQIFTVMSTSASSINTFRSALLAAYPNKATDIQAVINGTYNPQ